MVQFKEDHRCRRADALIPVHEGVVLDDMKEIGCRHFEEIGMKKLAAEASLGHRNGRLKEAHVADASAAPVSLNLITMELDHLVKAKEGRGHRLVCEALERWAITPIYLGKRGAESLLPRRVSHRGHDEALSIRRHRERRVAIDLKKVQYTSIDHEGQAIPMLCQALDHSNPPLGVLQCDNIVLPSLPSVNAAVVSEGVE